MGRFSGYVLISWTLVTICTSQSIVPELKFCAENSINTKTEKITLDGISAVRGPASTLCKCRVTIKDPLPTWISISQDLSSGSAITQCYTRLDVTMANGTTLGRLPCNKNLQLIEENIQAELWFYLHVSVPEQERTTSFDWYKVHIELDAASSVLAHCSLSSPTGTLGTPLTSGTVPPSTGTPLSSSSSSTTTTTTTTNITTPLDPVSSGSEQTVVIVVVVIGLGLFMLVFISCLLCYIARRSKENKDVTGIPQNGQDQNKTRHQNILTRTLTRARDRIRQARPLPKLPASLRVLSLRRQVIDRSCNSGYYASIRSNSNINNSNINNNNNNAGKHTATNGHVIQQLSVESSTSYIHPSEINSPARLKTAQQLSVDSNTSYDQPGDIDIPRRIRPTQQHSLDSNSSYLHPTDIILPTRQQPVPQVSIDSNASYIHPCAVNTVSRLVAAQQQSVDSTSSYEQPDNIDSPQRFNTIPQLSVESASSYSYVQPDQIELPTRNHSVDNDITERKVISKTNENNDNDEHNPYVNSPRKLSSITTVTQSGEEDVSKSNSSCSSVPNYEMAITSDSSQTVTDNSFYISPNCVKIPNGHSNINEDYVEPEITVGDNREFTAGKASPMSIELAGVSGCSCTDDYLTNPRDSDHKDCVTCSNNIPGYTRDDHYDNCNSAIESNTESVYENVPESGIYLPMNGVNNVLQDKQYITNEPISDEGDINESSANNQNYGYTTMKGCDGMKGKPVLKKVDSTFPNLLSFKAHGNGASTNKVDKMDSSTHNIGNNIKRTNNKVKRYVKEARTS